MIETDSGTPIAGWPENKVQLLANNKTKASQASASVQTFFPLNAMDLHPFWLVLLPMIFPLLAEYGLLFLGLPEMLTCTLAFIPGPTDTHFRKQKQKSE